ncbi:RPM1 interacting protein 13 [Cardamine amara subsp. amara]|uniref:RPM1 interacting protein 13 n=1 Tax=Cardamine amara subsp. amara TaxID=228776 RepID=A0ABD1A8T2_CARAN
MNNHIVDISSDEDNDKRDNFSDWIDEYLQLSDEKPKSTNSSDPMVEIKDEDDDDCVILDSDPMAKESVIDTIETDDVLVTGQKGEIACRDFPHPRHDCAKYQFKSTLHQQYCEMCHCYVCDTRAPCPYWYSGSSSVDHCHANDKEEIWKNQREFIRTGIMLPLPDSRPSSIIAVMGQVTRPRSIRVSHKSSSPLTKFGVRACSTSTKVATHPNTDTRPGYRTERSGTFSKSHVSQARAVQSYPNQRDGSYSGKPSPKKGVSSSPYTYRRPSRRLGSGVQNIAQGSQATHYTTPAASQASRYAPPPALQSTRTTPPMASQAARYTPPMATRYAPPPDLQAARNAPPMASQAARYAPPAASLATRYAPPSALQANSPPMASQTTRNAPPVASQATRYAPPVASQATRYAPPVASQATHSTSPAASQATHNTLPAASQTICNAPPMASQPTHSAHAASQATHNAPPAASQVTHNAPLVASQSTRYAPPRASQGNPQRIVTGYISSVPESPSKVYARQFNQKMYSANLQTNAVPSESHNPPANQRQQQSGRSNDKLLSEFEDWLLDDSTLAGPLCPLVGQRQC